MAFEISASESAHDHNCA